MKLLGLGLLLLASIAQAEVPQSKHIWMITEENHSYESVVGNSSMPHFNSLANRFGLATQYYSEQHNSLSALMWLVTGQFVTSNNQTTACYDVDNLARHLIASGYRATLLIAELRQVLECRTKACAVPFAVLR